MYCHNCGASVAEGATQCDVCGRLLVAGPPVEAVLVREPDATGGLIPYKNPKALAAYYLGILSMFPLVGLPLGIIAFVLGRKGLREAKEYPEVRGRVHAWIGIILGGGSSIVWTLLLVLIIVSIVAGF